MEYEKNVLLLKQVEEGFSLNKNPIGGIVRFEMENGIIDIYLSLLNFIAIDSGNYILFIQDRKGILHPFTLNNKPSTYRKTIQSIDLSLTNICVGICYVKNDIPLLIAFSSSKNEVKSLNAFKKSIADYYLSNFNREEKPAQTENNENITYDDEAVATDNYFNYSCFDNSKKEENNKENYNENTNNEDGLSFDKYEEKENKGREQIENIFDETDANNFKEDTEQPYYKRVEKELCELFNKFSHEEELERLLPNSKWAKINYANEKYYVVGVIKENEKIKYICYGLPSFFSEYAPKELEGYCSFLPTSIFDLKGKGYWMMFQDAITGACLKKEK